MAKISRISKGGKYKRYSGTKATLDLCRFDTKRLRSAIGKSRSNREAHRGTSYWYATFSKDSEITRRVGIKSEVKSAPRFRQLASEFVWTLKGCRLGVDRDNAPRSASEQRECFEKANQIEREIWQLQQRAGCKIRDTEQVARDLELENKPGEADRIRRSATRPRTSKKRGRHTALARRKRRQR